MKKIKYFFYCCISYTNFIANNSANTSAGIFVKGERTLITYCIGDSNSGDAIRVSPGINNSVDYSRCEGNSGSGLNISFAGASACVGFSQFNINRLFGILTVAGSGIDYYYNISCNNSSGSYSINGSNSGVVQGPGDAYQASSNLKTATSV